MGVYLLVLAAVLTLASMISGGDPPMLAPGPIDKFHVYRVGSSFRLTCPVQPSPTLMVEWYKDEETINTAWIRFQLRGRDNVHLKGRELQVEDSGVYRCKATNGFGSISVQYYLFIRPDTNETVTYPAGWGDERAYLGQGGEPPYFLRPDQMKKVNIMRPAGTTLRLMCKADGVPEPDIAWYNNGRQILQQDSSIDLSEPDHKWTLRLRDLTAQDSGSYMCRVSNRAGAINHTYTLEVVDSVDFEVRAPDIVSLYPKNASIVQNDLSVFHCQVRSSVQPKIKWLKLVEKGSPVTNKSEILEVQGMKFIVLKNAGDTWSHSEGLYLNKLTLPSVAHSDSGTYICLAANSMGFNFKNVSLSVVPGGIYGDRSLTNAHNTSSSDIPLLPIIIAASVAIVVIIVVMIVVIVRSRRRKGDTTPVKKSASSSTGQQQMRHSGGYSGVSGSDKHHHHQAGAPPPRCYDYQAIQPYPGHHGAQHELIQPGAGDSSLSDASTPHKYNTLQHTSSTPSPGGVIVNNTMIQQQQPQHPQHNGSTVMHLHQNPMIHHHQHQHPHHVHPAHAGMMAYHHPQNSTSYMHQPPPTHSPAHHAGGGAPPTSSEYGHEYQHLDGRGAPTPAPYMSAEYGRPPSPPATTHVVYNNC